ncbi:hypothetical protein EGW08_003051, partial [Elysia chlorotica]
MSLQRANNLSWCLINCFRRNSYYTVKKALELGVNDGNKDPDICIKGWVKNLQNHKGVMFMHVNDGTASQHLQVIVPQPLASTVDATFGSCVEVKGVLKESLGKGQHVELISSSVEVIGPCDPFEFPIKQRARHSPQYTRDYLHLRPKSNIFSALLRIRNVASMAVHSFFQDNGFMFIHTPILVTNDCEGACEVFKVEPLFTGASNSSGGDSDSEENDDSRGPQCVSDSIGTPAPSSQKEHFFGQPVFLTVSGQLHLEVMTGALTKVYNFGPCFRAENSHGSFHLSEFYMVEAELAFINHLNDLLTVSFSLHVLETYLVKKIPKANCSQFFFSLSSLTNSYLQYSQWGCDLDKEHEMYLADAVGGRPVFVTDYPASLKPFYALRNEDCQTV